MKALRKKYGKRPWIDTPNAAWYRKRCGEVRFLRGMMYGQIVAATHSNIHLHLILSVLTGGLWIFIWCLLHSAMPHSGRRLIGSCQAVGVTRTYFRLWG